MASISYGKPISTGIEMPKLEKEPANKAISQVVDPLSKNFESENKTLAGDSKAALLVGYESYKTPQPVEGVAIYHRERIEAGKEVKETTKVYTYNFSTKVGVSISPVQIFSGDYAPVYKEKVTAKLKKDYGDKLLKGYEEAIDKNADHFVMTKNGFKFFFDSGTVADHKEGAISVELSYDLVREDIGKRIIDPAKPMVAITYDDGPDANTTPQILDLYEKHDAVCTFFELGQNVDNVKGSAEILKRELALGCEVGVHTYTHPNLHTLPANKIQEEADKCKAAVKKATGKDATFFRPSYGNGSEEIAKIFDLPSINWTVDTLDWKSKNKDSIVDHVKKAGNLDGQIVLMHSIYQSSVDASVELVPWLQEQGYQLVTVTELLQYKYNHTPEKGRDYGYKFTSL
ncbi:MAG: polysaccharide deacetylase family protein [Anaerovoracaceae bacterium]